MKTIHIDLADEVVAALKAVIPRRRHGGLGEVVKEALALYLVAIAYTRQGRTLMFEDPKTKQRVELKVPGLRKRGSK